MLTRVECPVCDWEGQLLVDQGRALCPECEWWFRLPNQPWDATVVVDDRAGSDR